MAKKTKKPMARRLGAPGKSGAGLQTNEKRSALAAPSSRRGLPRALFKTAVATLRKGLRRVPREESFHIMPVGDMDVLKVKETSTKKGSQKSGARASKVGHGRKGRS